VTAPTTTATVLGRWFPADAVLPERRLPWHNVYVLCTDTDLCIWQRVSEAPDWSSPLEGAPQLPATDRVARNGFDVHTQAGLAVVTLGSGCRCGRLGKWAGPVWARTERARG
jgi:hypothetical protein